MGCFLPSEDTESFQFALQSFTSFGFKRPIVCITDQDKALTATLSQEWLQSVHLFCLFHIYSNIQQNAARFLAKRNTEFLKAFSRVQRIEIEEEFKEVWENLVSEFCEKEKTNHLLNSQMRDQNNLTDDMSYGDEESERSEEESNEEVSGNISSRNLTKLKYYLILLFDKRKAWAKCYTYRYFAAGDI